MKKYYVYILKDNGVPFYIGKGTGLRAYVHEEIVKGNITKQSYEFGLDKDYNPHKTRKIKKILKEGRNIEYDFPFSSDNEDEVFEEEKRLIAIYGISNNGGLLTNIHPGGVGGDCYSGLSDERKSEIRDKRKAHKHSIETIELIRKASTGRKHTKEAKEKIKMARTGSKLGYDSPKKGKPATGRNTKGIRKAWNKNLSSNDPLMINHKNSMRKWHDENPNGMAERQGLSYQLITPQGNSIKGKGINRLVREYGVSTRIRDLIRGRVDQYRGWKRDE